MVEERVKDKLVNSLMEEISLLDNTLIIQRMVLPSGVDVPFLTMVKFHAQEVGYFNFATTVWVKQYELTFLLTCYNTLKAGDGVFFITKTNIWANMFLFYDYTQAHQNLEKKAKIKKKSFVIWQFLIKIVCFTVFDLCTNSWWSQGHRLHQHSYARVSPFGSWHILETNVSSLYLLTYRQLWMYIQYLFLKKD